MPSPRPSRPSRRSGAAPARGAAISTSVDAVRRIVRALRLAEQRTLADAGVSAAQLFVLRQLSGAPAGSLSELGERTLTDRSSVAAVVERLEARGLVRRSPSAADRRRTTIGITPAGRALLRRAPQPPTELLIAALERLGDTALRELAHGLERLARAMGVDARPATMLFEETAPAPRGGWRGTARGAARARSRRSGPDGAARTPPVRRLPR